MLDIKFVRENPEIVKQNIRNKFQDSKLELVDKVLELDKENREIKQEVEALRAERNKISKQIGALMGQGKREEAEEVKKQVAASGTRIEELSAREKEVEEELVINKQGTSGDYTCYSVKTASEDNASDYKIAFAVGYEKYNYAGQKGRRNLGPRKSWVGRKIQIQMVGILYGDACCDL